MDDAQHERFLRRQLDAGMAFAESSDILDLRPEPGPLPERYEARLAADGLVRDGNGPVRVAHECRFTVWFCRGYQWRHDPRLTLAWVAPIEVFHPNFRLLSGRVAMCAGPIPPGTELVDLLTHVHGLWTWDIASLGDCLNLAAAQWGLRNRRRIPIDPRPIVWRAPRETGAAR